MKACKKGWKIVPFYIFNAPDMIETVMNFIATNLLTALFEQAQVHEIKLMYRKCPHNICLNILMNTARF